MNYVLPTLINARRIYFLYLNEKYKEIEDNFIVEIPEITSFEIIKLSKDKTIYTLIEQHKDIMLSDCNFYCTYDPLSNTFNIKISIKGNEDEQDQKNVFENNDLSFVAISNAAGFSISGKLKQQGNYTLKNEQLTVNITFIDEDGTSYTNKLTIFLANVTNFLQCGLDFGSEASQLTEKYYKKQGSVYKECVEDVNLFSVLANYKEALENPSAYLQHEPGTKYLKSIFFINNHIKSYTDFITDSKDLNVVTKSTLFDNSFLTEWKQLPNLKLAHKHDNILNDISFSTEKGGKMRRVNLSSIKDVAYSSIIKEIFAAYFDHKMSELETNDGLYFRITLLVPNIYNIDDIYNSKEIIRKIVNNVNNEMNNRIKGVEVLTLSESDASFLGYYKSGMKNTEKNKFYLIVDCGKGTTDFSILQTDKENANNIRPVYRNGFAGAGNLISFAFFDTLMSYLIRETDNKENAIAFFSQKLKDAESIKLYDLFNSIERLKKNYNSERTQDQVGREFKNARDGQITIKNLFDESLPNLDNINNITQKTQSIYDWNEYIETTINNIVDNIAENVAHVVKKIDADVACGGILFTGRTFLFTPLKKKLEDRLKSIDRLKNATISTPNAAELKSVCMKGIFKQGMITHSETNGSPLQVELTEADKDKIASKSTLKEATGFILSKIKALKSLVNFEIDTIDDFNYSQQIIGAEFDNLKFIIGSNLFYVPDPHFYDKKNTTISDYIFTNNGYIVRAFDDEQQLQRFSMLVKDDSIDSFALKFIIPSLFPNKIDAQFFRALNEDYDMAALNSDDSIDINNFL